MIVGRKGLRCMSQGTLAKVLFLCLLQFPAQSTRPLVYANSATANSLIFRKTDPYLLGFPFGMVLVRDAGAVVEELCVARTAEPKPVPSWITILSLRGGGSSTRLDALLDSVSARNPIRKKSSGVLKQSPKKRLSSGLSMEGSAVEEQHEMTSKDEFSRSMSGRNCGSSRGDSSQGEYVQSVEDCVAKDSASKRGAGVVGVDWKHVRTLRMGSNTSEPFDVAVGPNKSLYITDSLYHKIVIMDPVSGKIWGKIREKFGAYQLMSPCGVAFNEKGQLCIADTGRGRVLVVNPQSGALLMQIGSKGQEHGQFMFPFYVHVSLPGGDVWVADPRTRMVQRFDGSTGLLVSQLGAGESEPLKYPNGVVTMGDYVIASDSGMHRIRKYDLATGKELTRCGKYGRGQGEFNHPGALAVRMEDGLLFVADVHNHRVQVMRCEDLSYVLEIGGFGDADGEFVNPAGMALDSSGNLWVCDRENHRMQMFDIPLQGVTAER